MDPSTSKQHMKLPCMIYLYTFLSQICSTRSQGNDMKVMLAELHGETALRLKMNPRFRDFKQHVLASR